MHFIPSIEQLDNVSFESSLGQDFVNKRLLDLTDDDIDTIMEDLENISKNILEPFCAKSCDSAYDKIVEYKRKQTNYPLDIALNDFIRCRSISDSYPVLPSYLQLYRFYGCGYTGLHAYYQKSPTYYPIEIQYWLNTDADFNIWDHEYTYKIYPEFVTHLTRYLYDRGEIQTKDEFEKKVRELVDIYYTI